MQIFQGLKISMLRGANAKGSAFYDVNRDDSYIMEHDVAPR